jgi:hypothetical protein
VADPAGGSWYVEKLTAEVAALPDLDAAIRDALSSPIAGPPLRELAAAAASSASPAP